MNNAAIQRLAYKAGATRIDSNTYDDIRKLGENYIKLIVKYAIIYCENENKKTISDTHVIHAIERVGLTSMYNVVGDVKKCGVSVKVKLITRIKEYQNQHDCVVFSKAAIEREFRKFSGNAWRWSKEALVNAQFALEYMIYYIIYSALKIVVSNNRKTLTGSDIKVTTDIIATNCKTIFWNLSNIPE